MSVRTTMRRAGWVLAAPLLSLVLLSLAPNGTAEAPRSPVAAPSMPIPTVGALFHQGLANAHGCTASVLASPGGNLILTAAHCVSGTGAGLQFAPGYDAGRAPYGLWTVTQAYVDRAWKASRDPQHDYAILAVAAQTRSGQRENVEDVVGGEALGTAPAPGQVVHVVAYNAGKDDDPIGCRTHISYTQGYPTHSCSGYAGGSSGSPWLVDGPDDPLPTVVGVIGGLHQGGCSERTSYSSAFGQAVFTLLWRAEAARTPDTVPSAGGDGC